MRRLLDIESLEVDSTSSDRLEERGRISLTTRACVADEHLVPCYIVPSVPGWICTAGAKEAVIAAETRSSMPCGRSILAGYIESSPYHTKRNVRVIVGHLGHLVRMSAPELDIVVDGFTLDEAWAAFVKETKTRDDSDQLIFDVGPTRPEEIERGLDVPEDEDWSESIGKGIK